MEGLFVTGTNTDVGKTTLCAGLLKLLQARGRVVYWKPVQTGTPLGEDLAEVQALSGLPDSCFEKPLYRFPAPVAPAVAARQVGRPIVFSRLITCFEKIKKERDFVLVEGAGGILVPLTEETLILDLMRACELPALVVAQNKLGTINQTLLTVQALRQNAIEVAGVVLTRSQPSQEENARCIAQYGKVEILAELPEQAGVEAVIRDITQHRVLKRLFGSSRRKRKGT